MRVSTFIHLKYLTLAILTGSIVGALSSWMMVSLWGDEIIFGLSILWLTVPVGMAVGFAIGTIMSRKATRKIKGDLNV